MVFTCFQATACLSVSLNNFYGKSCNAIVACAMTVLWRTQSRRINSHSSELKVFGMYTYIYTDINKYVHYQIIVPSLFVSRRTDPKTIEF